MATLPRPAKPNPQPVMQPTYNHLLLLTHLHLNHKGNPPSLALRHFQKSNYINGLITFDRPAQPLPSYSDLYAELRKESNQRGDLQLHLLDNNLSVDLYEPSIEPHRFAHHNPQLPAQLTTALNLPGLVIQDVYLSSELSYQTACALPCLHVIAQLQFGGERMPLYVTPKLLDSLFPPSEVFHSPAPLQMEAVIRNLVLTALTTHALSDVSLRKRYNLFSSLRFAPLKTREHRMMATAPTTGFEWTSKKHRHQPVLAHPNVVAEYLQYRQLLQETDDMRC